MFVVWQGRGERIHESREHKRTNMKLGRELRMTWEKLEGKISESVVGNKTSKRTSLWSEELTPCNSACSTSAETRI